MLALTRIVQSVVDGRSSSDAEALITLDPKLTVSAGTCVLLPRERFHCWYIRILSVNQALACRWSRTLVSVRRWCLSSVAAVLTSITISWSTLRCCYLLVCILAIRVSATLLLFRRRLVSPQATFVFLCYRLCYSLAIIAHFKSIVVLFVCSNGRRRWTSCTAARSCVDQSTSYHN